MHVGLVVSGGQCRLRQWLEVHEPNESHNLRASAANSRRLREAIQSSREGRFDELFSADGIEVRVDHIEELPGGVGLRRFRPATRRKPWHVDELALQVHVLRACGLRVVSAEIWRLDRRYRRGAELDVDAALKRTELIAAVDERLESWLPRLPALVEVPAEQPAVPIGPHCTRPRRCPFTDRCGTLPREPRPSALQRRVEEARRTGRPVVDRSLVEDLLEEGPVHALDFEAWAPALPAFEGMAPFEPAVVQWCLSTWRGGERLVRGGFFEPGRDPRPPLAAALVEVLQEPGPVYVFSDFERRSINRLIEAVPEHAAALRAIRARLVDLLVLLREKYVHPGFDGLFGLKRVLPVLVPGQGYEDLELGDGGAAALAYGELVDPETPPRRRQEVRRMLGDYCQRDAEALLLVRQALLARLSP